MLVYTIKRFFEMVIVFFLFLVISYLLFNAIPGNAFQKLLFKPFSLSGANYVYLKIPQLASITVSDKNISNVFKS